MKEKLVKLQKEIEEYGKYLEESTYYPYNKVQSFAYKLNKIINEI